MKRLLFLSFTVLLLLFIAVWTNRLYTGRSVKNTPTSIGDVQTEISAPLDSGNRSVSREKKEQPGDSSTLNFPPLKEHPDATPGTIYPPPAGFEESRGEEDI